MNLKKPFEKNFRITQKFGEKFLYFGKEQSHRGLDFACPKCTPILAAHKGIVERVRRDESDKSYGFEVRIAGDDFLTQYAHLSEICVEEGKEIQVGDQVGLSGNTGFCLGKTGMHLHFGLKRGDEWVDPLPLLEEDLIGEVEEDEAEEVELPPVAEGETVEQSDAVTDPVEGVKKSKSEEKREEIQKKKVFGDASLVRQTVEKCVAIFGEVVTEIENHEPHEELQKEFEKRVKVHFQIDL